MSKGPERDTSLGAILLEWEVISREQLDLALRDQATLSGDALLGRLLVAGGACSEEEVSTAMSAQVSLRAADKHKCAMAVADLALERRRRDSVIVRQRSIIEKGEEVRRSITGDRHPALAPAMLAKPGDS